MDGTGQQTRPSAGRQAPDKRHLTLQLISKKSRRLMLEAAFQTTADMLILHAELGPEFDPEPKSARKPVVQVDLPLPGIVSLRKTRVDAR